jgi:hypothetical protein
MGIRGSIMPLYPGGFVGVRMAAPTVDILLKDADVADLQVRDDEYRTRFR